MNKIIDVHCHYLPKCYKKMVIDNHAELEDGFALPDWSPEEHIRLMDACGIGTSVISISSPHPYFGNENECIKITREMNLEAAELKDRYPGRFGFCASLPLPAVDAAAAEVAYAADVLHADGIKLPSNCRGLYLGDASLNPVFEEMNKRKMAMVIHPHKPEALTEGIFSSGPIPLFEFMCDTTRAVLNLMANGMLERYPDIKVVVPHCGSFLPNIAARLESLQPVLMAQGLLDHPIDVKGNIDKLYFDLAGTPAPDLLPFLLNITTDDRIMYGGDYPFTPAPLVKKNLERLEELFDRNETLGASRNKIMYENAGNVFSL